MKIFKLVSVLSIFLYFLGCTNNYRKATIYNNVGFADKKTGDNTYLIMYADVIEETKLFHKALVRASELTLQNGDSFFSIKKLDGKNNSSKYSAPKAHIPANTQTVYSKGNASVGVSGNLFALFFPKMHGHGIEITCYKDKPEFFSFDAKILYDTLAKLYGIKTNNKNLVKIEANPKSTSEKYTIVAIDKNQYLVSYAIKSKKSIDKAVEYCLYTAANFALKEKTNGYTILEGNFDFSKAAESIINQKIKDKTDYKLADPSSPFLAFTVIEVGKTDSKGIYLDAKTVINCVENKYLNKKK